MMAAVPFPSPTLADLEIATSFYRVELLSHQLSILPYFIYFMFLVPVPIQTRIDIPNYAWVVSPDTVFED